MSILLKLSRFAAHGSHKKSSKASLPLHGQMGPISNFSIGDILYLECLSNLGSLVLSPCWWYRKVIKA